jgi:hypothetical protein
MLWCDVDWPCTARGRPRTCSSSVTRTCTIGFVLISLLRFQTRSESTTSPTKGCDSRFDFRPRGLERFASVRRATIQAFLFRLHSVADYDRNGKKEIVGAFERFTLATGPLPVPVLISWNDGAQSYSVEPLTPEPPDLLRPRGLDPVVQDGYIAPTVIRDRHSGQRMLGHGVDEFEIAHAPTAPTLLTAYLEQTREGPVSRYEVKGYWIDLQAGTPLLVGCERGPRHVFVKAQSPTSLRRSMRRALLGGAGSRGCSGGS